MNDSKEISWLYELVKKVVWSELHSKRPPNELRLCQVLLEHCDNLFLDEGFFPHLFCSCFSKNGDSLGQWRAYANDGAGVAIGFNQTYLESLAIPGEATLSDVTYRNEDGIDDLKSDLNDALENLRKSELPTHEHQIALSAVEAQLKWFRLAPFCKNPGFREEQEVRLVHTAGPTGISRPKSKMGAIDFYHRRDVIVPYKSLPLDSAAKPIRKIVFGPRNRLEHNRSSISSLTSETGFNLALDQFEVSMASYGEIRRTPKLHAPPGAPS